MCLATRPTNGGIITMEDLVVRLGKSSGKTRKDVQPDDVFRAIGKLAVLGMSQSSINVVILKSHLDL